MTPIPLGLLADAIAKAKKAKKQRQFVAALVKAAAQPPEAPPTPNTKSNPGRCMCSTQGWDVWDWEFWYHECWRPLEPGECQ